jgi:hypothetical protein
MAEEASGLTGVDIAMLEPMVRDLLGEPIAVVTREWSCRPLSGGAGKGLGLYQLTGSAHVDGVSHPWALVCKVCVAAHGADPDAWDYPAREGLAFRSGLLDALPGGLTAPRCLAVETRPDGTGWLWLEGITDEDPGPWPLDRYVWVARVLGRFNGAYLAGVPLPDPPWLSRRFLRGWVEASGPAMAELEKLAGPGAPPLLWQLYPPPVMVELRRLWEERERFLTALDRLPQTFSHHDTFRRNLLVRRGLEGDELVAVDWAYAGHGAVGEELEQVVVASLFFFETMDIAPRDLDAACFAGYFAELREAGWAGDERLVRLGYTADAALRHTVGLVRYLLPVVTDPTAPPFVEELFRRPFAEVVAGWSELWSFQLELAEEARALLPMVG